MGSRLARNATRAERHRCHGLLFPPIASMSAIYDSSNPKRSRIRNGLRDAACRLRSSSIWHQEHCSVATARGFLHVSQYWWLGTISESNEKGFPSVSTKYGMAELLPMRSSKYRQSISSAFWISARFIWSEARGPQIILVMQSLG